MGSENDRERTLVIVKPDGVQRGLVGEIISRFERKGLKVIALKMMQVSNELAAKHYEEHEGKPFYEGLVKFITCSPVVAMAVQGRDVVTLVRNMIGALEPVDTEAGTIRGDLCRSRSYNVVHGSDSPENGITEVNLFFNAGELVEWNRDTRHWIRE